MNVQAAGNENSTEYFTGPAPLVGEKMAFDGARRCERRSRATRGAGERWRVGQLEKTYRIFVKNLLKVIFACISKLLGI